MKKQKKIFLLAAIAGILLIAAAILFTFREEKDSGSASGSFEPGAADTDPASGAPVSYGSSQSEDKAETVYVKADASGLPKEVTVEAILKNPGGSDPIPDRTTLSDIKNTEGDEAYTVQPDGSLLWENNGEDIHYKGISTKELPVSMSIRYSLNGQEIAPDDLAGQSGHLIIRFDYENLTADEADGLVVPFAAVTAVFLPSDVFYNVEVENGKRISVSGQNLVIGTVYPGLADSLRLAEYEPTEDMEIPDYVEITADVVDFELDFTATVITGSLLEDLETEDLDHMEELTDDMKELEDATDELADGTEELYDGVVEFRDGIEEYVDGTNAINDGIEAIYEGLDALYELKLPMREGADSIQAGLEALEAAVAEMQTQLTALQDSFSLPAETQTTNGDAPDGQTPDDSTPDGEASDDGIPDGETPDDGIPDGDSETVDPALAGTASAVSNMAAALEALKTSISQLAEGSRQMSEGVHAYTHGVTELYLGTIDLKDGSQELTDAGKELNDAANELLDGVLEFKDGVAEFREEGIQSLTDLAGDNLRDLIGRVRMLKDLDGNYQNFSGIQEGQTGTVRFIVETDSIE